MIKKYKHSNILFDTLFSKLGLIFSIITMSFYTLVGDFSIWQAVSILKNINFFSKTPLFFKFFNASFFSRIFSEKSSSRYMSLYRFKTKYFLKKKVFLRKKSAEPRYEFIEANPDYDINQHRVNILSPFKKFRHFKIKRLNYLTSLPGFFGKKKKEHFFFTLQKKYSFWLYGISWTKFITSNTKYYLASVSLLKKKNFFFWRGLNKFSRFKLPVSEKPTTITKKKMSDDKNVKIFDFSRKFIRVLWDSRTWFKTFFSRKRRWTARKFKNFFKPWYKKSTALTVSQKFVYLWEFLVYKGILLSKKEVQSAIACGLITIPECITVDKVSPEMSKLYAYDYIIYSPQLGLDRQLIVSRRSWYESKFKKHKYTQLVSFHYQWRQRARGVNKMMFNLFGPRRLNNLGVHHALLGSAIMLLPWYRGSSWAMTVDPRHQLEKLNNWKLRL